MKIILYLLLLICWLWPASLTAQWKKQFLGNINSPSPVALEVKLSHQNGQISGVSYYLHGGQEQQITGTLHKDELLLLQTNAKGALIGRIKASVDADGRRISGQWYTPDGRQAFPIELQEEEFVPYKIIYKPSQQISQQLGQLECSQEINWIEMQDNPDTTVQQHFNMLIDEYLALVPFPQSNSRFPANCLHWSHSKLVECTFKTNFFISLRIIEHNYECGKDRFSETSLYVIDLKRDGLLSVGHLLDRQKEKAFYELVSKKARAFFGPQVSLQDINRESLDNFYLMPEGIYFAGLTTDSANDQSGDLLISYQELRDFLQPTSSLALWLKEKDNK